MARCSLEPVPRLATKVTVTGSALVLLYFLWRSLAWPLVHDSAIMHYVAWLISQGAVPYRDAFDMNMPGVYLIHLVVLTLGAPETQPGAPSSWAGSARRPG